MRWYVSHADLGSSALEKKLADGWEPFAAEGPTIYLRLWSLPRSDLKDS